MSSQPRSSSRKYAAYLEKRRQAKLAGHGQLGVDAHESQKKRRSRSFAKLFSEYWNLMQSSRLRFRLGLALATLTCSTTIALTFPWASKIALDYILTDNPGPQGIPDWIGISRDPKMLLLALSGAMIVIAVLSVIIGTWGRYQATRLTKHMQSRIRKRVFEHAVRLPLSRIYQIKSGGASSILREDAGSAAELLFSMMYNPWRAVVQVSGTLLVLAIVDWQMLVGAVIMLPLMYMTHKTWISRIRPVWRDIRYTRQGVDSHATEAFGGMRVVRGFNRERSEALRFMLGNHFMIRQEMLAWWASRSVEIAWMILVPIASSAVLLYGGSRVIDGTLTLGDVFMFSAYLMMLLGPLEMLASSATNMQNSLSGLDRILDLLEEPKEFADTASHIALRRETARGDMVLQNVSFTYPGTREPVIKNVSLTVNAGETIAFVGPSGSGKTTLCNLIARFYDPQEGSITFDGDDLREIDVDSFRRLLGIVEQDVFLFDGSVGENIAYGRRGATQADIWEAAQIANADGFIEKLEKGYRTLVGERGVRLSGGQKQRIAIARAVLADPKILILDEATSSLDSESERLIQSSLERLMQGRTSFVIAHRLSTIRHADRIVVLEDGSIIEVGSHEELLAQAGRYSEFLRLQVEDADSDRRAMDASV